MEVKFTIPPIKLDFLKEIKISHVLLVSAILRFFIMPFPQDGTIFDEAHYTKAVQVILQGIHANPEHPPLTKLIVAGFVQVLGNYWLAWRLPMIICSLASTYFVYLIAKEFFNEQLALLASSFIIFDIIWFIHGNIFMLEPPAMTFGLLFILMYLRGRYKWSAVSFSLACLANEKALFFLIGIGLYGLMTTNLKMPQLKPSLKKVVTFFLIFGIVGIGGLGLVDWALPPSRAASVNIRVQSTIYKNEFNETIKTETSTTTETNQIYLNNPIEHGLWMWSYYSGINSNLETPEDDFRPAWNWVTPFTGSRVSIFNSPKYLVTAVKAGDKTDLIINYRAQVPIFIWYMTFPIIGLALYNRKEKEAKFMLAWISGTYLPWFIKDIFQMNMNFNHYFQFTIPIVCIGIPWFWYKTVPKYWKKIVAVQLICTIIFFFWFFPVGFVRTLA